MTTHHGMRGATSSGGLTTLTYTVPLETAGVQFVPRDGSYWQRPISGYGLFSFGRSISRPTEMVEFAADGTEMGR